MQYNAVLNNKANREQTLCETTKPQVNSAFGVPPRSAEFRVLRPANTPAVFAELNCQWSIGLLQSLKCAVPVS